MKPLIGSAIESGPTRVENPYPQVWGPADAQDRWHLRLSRRATHLAVAGLALIGTGGIVGSIHLITRPSQVGVELEMHNQGAESYSPPPVTVDECLANYAHAVGAQTVGSELDNAIAQFRNCRNNQATGFTPVDYMNSAPATTTSTSQPG